MKDFLENPYLLVEEFNSVAAVAQRKAYITVGIEIQKEEIKILDNYRGELNKLKKEFVQRELESEANMVYCIDNSLLAVQCELKMLVYIKEDMMASAWENLVNAQVTYENVIGNCMFDIPAQRGYFERLASYEKLLFPKQYFHSVGGVITKSHCSICGESFIKCDHIKGRLYMGELCSRIITDIDLEEVSFVDNPANKNCRVVSIESKGKFVDILTLRSVDNL